MLQVQFIGALGADVVRYSDNGRAFYVCRAAHNLRYTRSDGTRAEETQWVDVILAERFERIAPYLVKGTTVYVSGRLSSRVYSSAKDKCMKCGLSISADVLELIGSGSKRQVLNEKQEEAEDGAPF